MAQCPRLSQGLPALYRSGALSDATLLLCDEASGAPVLEIRAHRFVLCSGAAPVLRRLAGALAPEATLVLRLDFARYSVEAVRLFFGLLYHEALDRDQSGLLAEERALLGAELHQLHQLALYFQYEALVRACLAQLYARFSLASFAELCAACLRPEAQGTYSVVDECAPLYAKLLAWYGLCIDEEARDDAFASMLKSAVLRAARASVSNFDRVCARRCQTRLEAVGAAWYLDYQRKMCARCLASRRVHRGHTAYIDAGYVARRADVFVFWAARDGARLDFYMSQWVAQGGIFVPLQDAERRVCGELRLFSRALQDAVTPVDEAFRGGQPEFVGGVALHAEAECYEACCDGCRRLAPCYVFSWALAIA